MFDIFKFLNQKFIFSQESVRNIIPALKFADDFNDALQEHGVTLPLDLLSVQHPALMAERFCVFLTNTGTASLFRHTCMPKDPNKFYGRDI
jgi:hypothetical protein